MAPTSEDLPVIDLSQDEEIVVAQLMDALTSIGFCTLVHHGVDDACFEKAFAASKSFFDLPTPIKTKYKFQGHDSNRGYLTMGSETYDQLPDGTLVTLKPDAKETFDIGKEDEPGYQNKWPDELQDTSFRNDLLAYFQNMDGLFLKLMKWIGIGLKLPDPERLVQACNGQHENLRMLHYPASTTASSVRGNIHTDFGALTLLLQDQVGGLQVQNRDGTWISVTPVPNAIVLNVGDMLMRWTNDVLKATPHHVVTPSKYNDTTPERYSIAFFCNANKETMIECLETCRQSSPAKYPPVSSHEYITKRLSETIQSDKPIK
jgi:isopenicillin N synthase-like dioxygenase